MTFAAGCFFLLALGFISIVLMLSGFSFWTHLRSGRWFVPIWGGIVLVIVSWLGSIFYWGTVNRWRYPLMRPEEVQGLAGAGAGNHSGPSIEGIRAERRSKRHRREKILLVSGAFLFGICCIGYQTQVNGQNRKLLTVGHRTQGLLENITITKHFWLSDYSFDVSYTDDAGVSHRVAMDANAGLFAKNTTSQETFSHHPIEVTFLSNEPELAGLPDALGPSLWGYVFAIVLFSFGVYEWRKRPQSIALSPQSGK